LQNHYPGLGLYRFLLEVKDILQTLTHAPLLSLSHHLYEVSPLTLEKLKERFLAGIPFAYLTGWTEFYDHRFVVSPAVLIPRPETELLIDLLVRDKRIFSSGLDLGTGSGVIILSLIKRGVITGGLASDISSAALDVAQVNANNLRLSDKVQFRLGDRFTHISESFELIVSNPPYIKESSHLALVHLQVHQHEPHLALYLPDEKYRSWFNDFFIEVKAHLLPGGVFMMEGHELEVHEQALQLTALGFKNVEVLNDLCQRPRFLKASV
jgi:release factor glutamine methyltransferase